MLVQSALNVAKWALENNTAPSFECAKRIFANSRKEFRAQNACRDFDPAGLAFAHPGINFVCARNVALSHDLPSKTILVSKLTTKRFKLAFKPKNAVIFCTRVDCVVLALRNIDMRDHYSLYTFKKNKIAAKGCSAVHCVKRFSDVMEHSITATVLIVNADLA